MIKVSIIIITKEALGVVEDCLASISGWVEEILVVDDEDDFQMKLVCQKYKATFVVHKESNLGAKKKWAVEQAKCPWVFILDADERVSSPLRQELEEIFSGKIDPEITSFVIPFQNHFLGRAVRHGGEDYKMPRIFRKNALEITPLPVHEGGGFVLQSGKAEILKNHILHFSYRSLFQVYKKFTDYGIRDGKQKYEKGEIVTWKKLFLYPIHMVWARYVEDKGYLDGMFRLPLDIGFGYMEAVTYWTLLFYRISSYISFHR